MSHWTSVPQERLAAAYARDSDNTAAAAAPPQADQRMVAATDLQLVWAAVGLMMLGFVMVYSASLAIAEASRMTDYNPYFYIIRHGIFLLIGLIAAGVVARVPMRQMQELAPWLFLFGVLLLVLVLIPGIGRSVNGAQRWINLGVVNLQPSELMKVFVVLYAADYTVRKLPDMHTFRNGFRRGFLPMAGAVLLVGFLLLCQPDFGAFVVIVAIAFGILFFGGINGRLFTLLAGVAVAGLVLLIWLSPYRRDRLLFFMDPWQDAFGSGYQLTHALIAFGRGEWLGVGLGASVEKLFYLPEAHTDFLLAVIAEELGFVGVATVVCLFFLVVYRAFEIGRTAIKVERYFSGLVALGIGLWIGVQSFINIGVNMGMLPTKGLTLPLMSFGGSAIVANCIALAILLRVDWENRQLQRGRTV